MSGNFQHGFPAKICNSTQMLMYLSNYHFGIPFFLELTTFHGCALFFCTLSTFDLAHFPSFQDYSHANYDTTVFQHELR